MKKSWENNVIKSEPLQLELKIISRVYMSCKFILGPTHLDFIRFIKTLHVLCVHLRLVLDTIPTLKMGVYSKT